VAQGSLPKQVIKIALSMVLLVVLGGIAIVADDRSLSGVAIVFGFALGIPFLLLSLVDLGRTLRSRNNGNYKASKTTWFLSQLQAAFGSVSIAATAYGLYHAVSAWYNGSAEFNSVMLFIWVPTGLGMIVVGFHFIWSAFVPVENHEESYENDT